MSDAVQGLLAGWLSAPLIAVVGWCIWQLVKLGLEARRERKEEAFRKLFEKLLSKQLTPRG